MRQRARRLVLLTTALFTAAATAAPAPAADHVRGERHPSHGGLSATIRYTEYGIPHILAKDYTNLGFGTGWAQAQDNVCVLAEGFVTLRGERSKYFGEDRKPDGSLSSASTNASSDLFFRGIREAGTVEKLAELPPPLGNRPEQKKLVKGFAAGYNAWLRQNRITDPACKGADWVRPVSELDMSRLAFALSVLGGQGRAADAITSARPPAATGQKAEDTSAEAKAEAARELFATDDAAMGSNAVAFHGSTTANGRGLLLGNPHYPWQGGRRFWQVQQTIPGELNVSGGSLIGAVTPSIGFTPYVAWSHTVATGVPMNLHQLTLDPADPTTYLVDGKPRKMTKRTVTVDVKGGAPVTRDQWWTEYGPVVTSLGAELPLPWTTTTAYALNDPNSANLRASDTALGFARARSVQGIQEVLRGTQGLPWVNTIAADSRGHSLYTQSQVLPRITDDIAARCSTLLGKVTYPTAGLAVLDGSRSDCGLGRDQDALQPGILGPSRMPTLVDAPYAENSNDSAWLANADRPLRGYERVFGNIDTPRSMRTRGAIEDVAAMAERGKLTVADLQAQQFANRAPAGTLGAARAAEACAQLPGGMATGSDGKAVDVTRACTVLKNWDRTMDADSRGALLYDRFWRGMRSALGPQGVWTAPFDPADPVRTPHTLNTASPAFARALADAVTQLTTAGIALDARLGEHQYVVRDGKRIQVPGGTESLGVWNKIEPIWNPAAGYTEVSTGSSHIQAVGWDGSRCPVARTLLTYSQSQNPHSPHFSDQTRLFAQEKWVTSRFCEKDIMRSPALKVVKVKERR
ncbi:penicillin acylase family protein [Streptomyces sp. TRM66268-LWL]|uniref:Penicillin acylase family protein n=1 Tax=Streptomyces polyasparticus TaxID=2767826 RepID=A0ABR7SKG2_9ACTN|nr:penicillin acylase family protein [Streptomyces polyasparticus]MBC9714986.1 penicillin acylase family protein [Streptomyces polyasparticus]